MSDVTPLEIEADRAAGSIRIAWDDGHESVYPVETLRWACPCALCAGEWGRPGRLSQLSTLPADELVLRDVHAVGAYGISPIWASGHSEGIFSWDYLRKLCPCQECASGLSVT